MPGRLCHGLILTGLLDFDLHVLGDLILDCLLDHDLDRFLADDLDCLFLDRDLDLPDPVEPAPDHDHFLVLDLECFLGTNLFLGLSSGS